MVCHGQHTYVYSQLVNHILARESKGGSSMKRLSQEITKCAQKKLVYSLIVFLILFNQFFLVEMT